MELKTKYQYTYYIYPFVIKAKEYRNFISRMVIDNNWNIRLFNKTDDEEINSHFLVNAKNTMFPSLNWHESERASFKKLSNKNKINKIISMPSIMFEYKNNKVSKGKIGEENTIFFEISKINLMCYKDGICFLILKTELDEGENISFRNILNLNYKFRNITPRYISLKDYENIKIQSDKFETIEDIKQFMKKICNVYEDEEKNDLLTDRAFVYSYVCLNESEWNSKRNFDEIRSEFLKYQYVLSGDYLSEFSDKLEFENTYTRWKYSIYGFTKMSGVVFSSAIDHFNFTKLPFYYENVYMYIMIYTYYQRIQYMMFLKDIENIKNKNILKGKLINMIKNASLGQIVNTEHGMNLYTKWTEAFGIKHMQDEVIRLYELI